jgi:hypothetical protein
MTGPYLQLHPRHRDFTKAGIDIGRAVIKATEDYNLTPNEIMMILVKELKITIALELKWERKEEEE